MKKALSDVYIRAIQSPLAGRIEVVDTKVSGLTLRVSQTGVKAWALRYRAKGKARVQRISLGRFPTVSLAQARKLALDHKLDVARGGDPQANVRRALIKDREGITVGELLDRFTDEYVKVETPKSLDVTKSYLASVRADWGSKRVGDVTREFLKGYLKKKAEQTPIAANRVRSKLIQAFAWAVDEALITTSPAIRIPKYGKETSRDRVMTDSELRAIWNAFTALDDAMKWAFRLLALTGQRPGEIIGLRRNELFDLRGERPRMEFQPDRVKNARRHVVPLSVGALQIVNKALAVAKSAEFVFPSFRNPGEQYDVRSFARAMKRVIDGVEVTADCLQTLKSSAPTPHDFRRTMTTGLSRFGVTREIRKHVINHQTSDRDVLAVYDRYEWFDEKKHALTLWDAHVRKVISTARLRAVAA